MKQVSTELETECFRYKFSVHAELETEFESARHGLARIPHAFVAEGIGVWLLIACSATPARLSLSSRFGPVKTIVFAKYWRRRETTAIEDIM